jgi:RNA polymerase sigma-70 factor (ECF subfamily)
MRYTEMSPTTEQQLIVRAATGDLDAFNRLVLLYQGLAYSIALRTLQDGDAAADAVQESMVKAFRSIGGYAGGSFKSWMLRIVINTCYDVLRLRKRRRLVSLEEFVAGDEGAAETAGYGHGRMYGGSSARELEDPGERPDTYTQRMELRRLIEEGIAGLPADQRVALMLCDVHGYAYDEIGEITGMPMGTVKSRINRARARLRTHLLQHPDLLPGAFTLPPRVACA